MRLTGKLPVKTLVLLLAIGLLSACGKDQDEPAVTVADSNSNTSALPVAAVEPVARQVLAAQETMELLPHQQMAKDFLRELVEIDTTHSSGDATRAAQAMADRLIAAGFPADDVKVLAPVPGKGNLVARYPGRDSALKPLLLLAHIDVVEANAADWEVDPFSLTEKDGFYYGRGTTDDKDEAAIHIANLIRMKNEGYQPERGIVVLLSADEEGGPHNGVKWLVENHPQLIDAAYALNEGGGGNIRDGRYVSNTVQASEKVYQSFTIEFTNPGGHSSLPVKDNAIYHLADALVKIRDHDFPPMLNEVTRLFFERSAPLEEGSLRGAMLGVLQTPPDPAALTYLADMPYFNSRLRTTCVATRVDAGHRDNALPQHARATINCRVLPGVSIEAVENTLKYVIGNEQVRIERVNEAVTSPPSPLTAEVLGSIESITQSMWPGVPVIPVMSTGATDARYLRNAGIPVYGVSGLFTDMDDSRMHGQNERIIARTFFEGQEFLYRLTRALTQQEP